MFSFLTRKLAYGFAILIGINLLTFVLFFKVNTPDDVASASRPMPLRSGKQNVGMTDPCFSMKKSRVFLSSPTPCF